MQARPGGATSRYGGRLPVRRGLATMDALRTSRAALPCGPSARTVLSMSYAAADAMPPLDPTQLIADTNAEESLA